MGCEERSLIFGFFCQIDVISGVSIVNRKISPMPKVKFCRHGPAFPVWKWKRGCRTHWIHKRLSFHYVKASNSQVATSEGKLWSGLQNYEKVSVTALSAVRKKSAGNGRPPYSRTPAWG